MARYILNRDNKIAHDSENLNEKCNTDQIRLRRVTDILPNDYHKCQHCMGEPLDTEPVVDEDTEDSPVSESMAFKVEP